MIALFRTTMTVNITSNKLHVSCVSVCNCLFFFPADSLLDPEIGALEGQVIDRNCDCCERWMISYVEFLKLQNHFYEFVSSPLFDLFITFCIIMNTFFLSLEHHNQPDALTTTLAISNYVSICTLLLRLRIK